MQFISFWVVNQHESRTHTHRNKKRLSERGPSREEYKYESVYYSCIGIILLFIFPFCWYRLVICEYPANNILTKQQQQQIFPFQIYCFASFCLYYAFSYSVGVVLRVHQTNTTHSKFMCSMLNHVCEAKKSERKTKKKNKNQMRYHILDRIYLQCRHIIKRTKQEINTANKNNWMKSRKIDLCARWKLEGKSFRLQLNRVNVSTVGKDVQEFRLPKINASRK